MDEEKPRQKRKYVRSGSKLTSKQERLAKLRVKNPNASLQVLARGAGLEGGATSAWRALNIPHVKARIRDLLEANPNLQLPALTKKLEEGLAAKEIKFFAHEGQVVSERTTVDYGTRHRYLETALELHGAKEKAGGDVVNNFFTKDAIEAFVEAFKRPPPPNAIDP